MSDVLREHIQTFGFSHAEIARRSARLNQATAYRVVEGDTANPSLSSLSGIIEAVALTDADAGVLYRRTGISRARPRRHRPPEGIETHAQAADYAHRMLDAGRLREAAYGVMAMFDLASEEEELCDAYEQAGILYMGLGRWEEAQVNLEAADAQLPCNLEDPETEERLIRRKHSLMTNIGSLMAKRGNHSWALLFGRAVSEHPRASRINRGWGLLVQGEAALGMGASAEAAGAFTQAQRLFTETLQIAESMPRCAPNGEPSAERRRRIEQAQGNLRWTRVHRVKSLLLQGDSSQRRVLRELEAEWMQLDPEASAMAGLFYAEQLPPTKRRQLLLQDLKKRAQCQKLGEIVQRVGLLLGLLLGLSFQSGASLESLHPLSESPSSLHEDAPPWVLFRGNTGG